MTSLSIFRSSLTDREIGVVSALWRRSEYQRLAKLGVIRDGSDCASAIAGGIAADAVILSVTAEVLRNAGTCAARQ